MNTHIEQQVKKLKHRVMRGLVLHGPSQHRAPSFLFAQVQLYSFRAQLAKGQWREVGEQSISSSLNGLVLKTNHTFTQNYSSPLFQLKNKKRLSQVWYEKPYFYSNHLSPLFQLRKKHYQPLSAIKNKTYFYSNYPSPSFQLRKNTISHYLVLKTILLLKLSLSFIPTEKKDYQPLSAIKNKTYFYSNYPSPSFQLEKKKTISHHLVLKTNHAFTHIIPLLHFN